MEKAIRKDSDNRHSALHFLKLPREGKQQRMQFLAVAGVAISLFVGGFLFTTTNVSGNSSNDVSVLPFPLPSYLSPLSSSVLTRSKKRRRLEEELLKIEDNEKDDNDETFWVSYYNFTTDDGDDYDIDYSSYSCDHIYIYSDRIQERFSNESRTEQFLCDFSTTCGNDDGLIFAKYIYCNTRHTAETMLWIFIPIFVILSILFFRMVASTAEDFFCPALEMLSVKMGLPARFAGVTLLALGNGAPDIAATVNAIRDDLYIGYLLGLGELTGAGMFISTVVTGSVIVLASNESGHGILCNGALLRDVIMLAFVCSLLLYQFKYSCTGEEDRCIISTKQIHTWLYVYLVYVLIVLASDLYQKRKKKKRRSQRRVDHTTETLTNDEDKVLETTPLVPSKAGVAVVERTLSSGSVGGVVSIGSTVVEEMIQFVSNYNETTGSGDSNEGWNKVESIIDGNKCCDDAGDNELEITERLPVVHMQHGGLKYIPYSKHHHHHHHEHHSHIDLLKQDGCDDDNHGASNLSNNQSVFRERRNDSGPTSLATTNLEVKPGNHDHDEGKECKKTPRTSNTQNVDFHNNTDDDDDKEDDDSTVATYSTSWKDALAEGKFELYEYMVKTNWIDIYLDTAKSLFVKIFLTLELPFTIARQLTIPIPCDGYYCRPLLGISTMLSPLWFRLYFIVENDVDILTDIGEDGLWNGIVILTIAFVCGLAILRYGPCGIGPMPAIVSAPLSIYGFVVAATWIDLVADKLVDMLSFLGIVFHIPGPIMGLSVLAIGNSIGDLAANDAVARKGLANMAITACFAGPVFNYLIGLGIGFSALQRMAKMDEIPVDLPFPLEIGLICTIINCLMIAAHGLCWGQRGVLQTEYGYIAILIYVIYALLSLFY